MERVLEPEWLDALPPYDARAQRSRADLRRVNALMGNARHVAGALTSVFRPPDKGGSERILRAGGWFSARPNPPLASLATPLSGGQETIRIADLGAGDGAFMQSVARRMARPGVELTLVDRAAAADPEPFARRQWKAAVCVEDVHRFLARPGPCFDAIVANLFLHHFEPAALRELLALAARRTRLFLACEPRRSRFALQASRLLGVLGCNDVTRHDAAISVRAGFRDGELSALWPRQEGWRLSEGPAPPFGHFFVARRDAPV